jgi:hypothetical protein
MLPLLEMRVQRLRKRRCRSAGENDMDREINHFELTKIIDRYVLQNIGA